MDRWNERSPDHPRQALWRKSPDGVYSGSSLSVTCQGKLGRRAYLSTANFPESLSGRSLPYEASHRDLSRGIYGKLCSTKCEVIPC